MKGDKQAYQIQLWALVGPLVCLFSLFVISVKSPQVSFFIPFTLLIGMPACWQWRLWGWGAATLLLFGFLAYEYHSVPLEERFWLIGISFSNVLALLITALSFEEVESLLESLEVESRSRLENLWELDERKQAVERELTQSKDEVERLKIKVRSFQKFVDLSTEGMHAARLDYNKVLEEFRQVKEENVKLKEQLKKGGGDPQLEAKYQQLKKQFHEKSQVLNQTRQKLFESDEKLVRLQREFDEEKWYSLSEIEESLEKHLLAVSKEKEDLAEGHQREVEALQALVDTLLKG